MVKVDIDLIAHQISKEIIDNLNPGNKSYELEKNIVQTSVKICKLMLKAYQEQLLNQK